MNSGGTAIKVEGLGKKYRVGQSRGKHDTLRDSIMRRIYGTFGRGEKPSLNGGGDSREFWALRDVSFDVTPGEIVGVIGRNGAGKSTLLKTLARITEPSEGTIDIYGRVGSLLEVGTGFHPELSGRENVFLSGSILGMKKIEIERHFDEIVDFAEVERFIDTAVKHYSSGMYLRLAFGVAAFLQPEILLIDEVLAVGDAAFQKKCLGKMDDVARQGRTVLFVSHNMSAIQQLCQRGILIDSGSVKFDGPASQCIAEYFATNYADDAFVQNEFPDEAGLQVYGLKIDGAEIPSIEPGQGFTVSLKLRGKGVRNPAVILIIENVSGQQVVHNKITTREIGFEELNGSYKVTIALPGLWLSPGVYSVYFKLLTPSLNAAGRSHSERLMLEVRGEMDKTGKTILSPNAEWVFEDLRTKPAQLPAAVA
jgi:lipopolysaccharide transport system ATP-binding protein